MLGPSAVQVEIWKRPILNNQSGDWELLYSDVECDPPTPLLPDTDLMPVVEVSEQHYQSWTEDERTIERNYKLVWNEKDYLIKDISDPFDIPVGRTSRRLHLVRIKR